MTISEVEAEPVESGVQVSSVQNTTLHRLLDVLSLEVELLQSCVQVLETHTGSEQHLSVYVHKE